MEEQNKNENGTKRDGAAKNNAKKPEVKKPEPLVGTFTVVGINFHRAGKVYYFSPGKEIYKVGDRVIVETSRGIEIGTVKIPNREIDGSEITPPLKPIRRRATASDLERDARNREMEIDAALICKKKIKEHGLGMRLVAAEYTFDNSKLIFYFTCESRVDFRELVKDLACTFRTRIELRQIGIRDEAKMMGGLAACGRPYCCSDFLSDFVQVSIKMAKEQNFSLNSAKVSGACGRLMCCLQYEHPVYEEAIKVTPPVGCVVSTPDGEGAVIETRPLAGALRVKLSGKDKDDIRLYRISEIKVLRLPAKKNDKKAAEENS